MKALTIGGAMVDTIAIIESDRIERMSMLNADNSFLLLEEGRKTEAQEISTHVGGGAVNAAVAMARLGFDVASIIKLGRDERAEIILKRLEGEGVSTRYAKRDTKAPTGASVLISSHDRNAAIFTFRGANTLLEACDLKDDALTADLVYVSSLSNKSADCFPDLVQRAKAKGALVATNPGVRQLSARSGDFKSSLKNIDILIVNRAEADVLVPALVQQFGEGGQTLELKPGEEPPALVARGLVGGGFEMSLSAFCESLHSSGVGVLLLTDGRSGAYVARQGEILHCPAMEAEVAGTAGAGDAFGATFAAMIALGVGAGEAAKAATLNATSVVGYVDTQSGLLSRAVLDERVAKSSAQLGLRTWKI